MTRIAELKPNDRQWFPSLDSAIDFYGQDGLLAIGGDLTTERLVAAYRNTIFPWYEEGCEIMWWTPSERAVIFANRIHVSRGMRRIIRQQRFRVTWNQAFARVVHACAKPRANADGTWIIPEMMEAYIRLHREGLAQSCEIWAGDDLVGGIYGVTLGKVFFGESMFHHQRNASKLALITVAQSLQFDLIDCQMPSNHLTSMGAEMISRDQMFDLVQKLADL